MIGDRVDDVHGARVGRVENVEGNWLLVKLGHFGEDFVLVPSADTASGGGHVYVPFEREVIRTAPRVELLGDGEQMLRAHYGLDQPAPVLDKTRLPA